MHGLIFETSIWLLAGSTRLSINHYQIKYHGYSFTIQPEIVMKNLNSDFFLVGRYSLNILFQFPRD